MTYDNFVKTYYRKTMKIINKYNTYRGSIAEVVMPEWILKREHLHFTGENQDFFGYELDIDAPVEKFVEHIDYLLTKSPDLYTLLWPKNVLLSTYEQMTKEKLSDDSVLVMLDVFLESAASVLEKMHILGVS